MNLFIYSLARLQGACGTCPSSSATMKMGIERALKAAFGDALKDVMQASSWQAGGCYAAPSAGWRYKLCCCFAAPGASFRVGAWPSVLAP